ncbi:MAG: 50S ribosomal protein L11 methyltransferase, partial [Thermodesulfobacteriota bacterium]
YIYAVKKNINKDSVVLDLGAGTGIFSLLACKFGARKVYAIEPNPAVKVGIQSAGRNGFSERIKFYNQSSLEVNLDEKVDLIISDLRGVLPLLGNNIETLIDARERFLKKSGILIPGSDKIYASIVNSPKKYKKIVNTWDKNRYKFDLTDARYVCLNKFYSGDFKSSKIVSERKLWQKIDYSKINHPNFKNKLRFKILEDTLGHGFNIWFDSVLVPGVNLLNSPDVPGAKVYGRAFFPFLKPIDFNRGDSVTVELSADLVSGEYVWSWKTRAYSKGGRKIISEFNQSTFYSNSITPESLIKRSHDFYPEINDEGKINIAILSMFSKGKNNMDIAKELISQFPEKFKNINESLSYAGNLAEKYSK